MNAERRIQRVRQAVEPLGDAKPDWEIICIGRRGDGPRTTCSTSPARARSGTRSGASGRPAPA